MKYNENNQPLVCMQTNSTCYKNTETMEIKGILWHSTGAPNPELRRYVQPSEDDPNYIALLRKLGRNQYDNDWNHIVRYAGLNAWIGEMSNGEVATVQTMPWTYRPWGCGEGRYGSCNDGWIQFEICEPENLSDPVYFSKIYKEACELTAYLCKKFNINPHGKVLHNGIQVPTILCHGDSVQLGVGEDHVDINHWFPMYGKSMSSVRADVAKLLTEEEDDEDMTQEKFNEMMNEYIKQLSVQPPSDWSLEARVWAEQNGLIQGDQFGNKQYKKSATREELVQFLYRIWKKAEEEL